MKSWTKFFIAVFTVFLIIEASAALWHLLLFRAFYQEATQLVDRGLNNYVIGHLVTTNLSRSLVIVLFFNFFSKGVLKHLEQPGEVSPRDGIYFGTFLGVVSALMAVEYYGIWKISSYPWVLMEGSWATLQGSLYGWGLGLIYREKSQIDG
ncbi:MAG: hypothetical protein HC880_13240 [Bacteroidia bacterium]|nr:hypothetical protein [Bacteroidia bacterium]